MVFETINKETYDTFESPIIIKFKYVVIKDDSVQFINVTT